MPSGHPRPVSAADTGVIMEAVRSSRGGTVQGEQVDWVEAPAGLLCRGTSLEEVADVTLRHADSGVPVEWYKEEVPRAEIHVPAFRIARTPVTVGRPVSQARAAHPVTGVGWEAATVYCRWLGERLGLDVRLPTEDEGERAVRGDDGREFPWGEEYRTGLADLVDLGIGTTTPVGSFPEGAGPFGVWDPAGNVGEWTSILYGPYPGASTGVPGTEGWAFGRHITRGGSFRHDRDLARCARRHGACEPDLEAIGVGFRSAAPAA
jgi:formylglycine-generating enzyme required for sulfatase activity